MSRVTISVGGELYSDWQAVKIVRSLERFPSSFQLQATTQGQGTRASMINPLSPCEILVDGVRAITGYVDTLEIESSVGGTQIGISGRGKGGDLVDCSLILPGETQQLSAVSFRAMVEALTRPYSITVAAPDGNGPAIPIFNTSLGDTPFTYIDEASRFASMLVTDDAEGNLVIQKAGQRSHSSGFAEGINVESARVIYDAAQRFSNYLPVFSPVNNLAGTGISNSIIANVVDPTMANDPNRRFRPRYIVAEPWVNNEPLALLRARWEAVRRYGRSQQVTLTCDSWTDSAGNLWTPNQRASLHLPSLRLSNKTWIIVDVVFVLSGAGSRADVTLMPLEALSIEPTTFGAAFQGDTALAIQQGIGAAPPATTPPTPPSR